MDLFTITVRHVLALLWIAVWSVVFLAPNHNEYYTRSDRIIGWIGGLIIGWFLGYIIL